MKPLDLIVLMGSTTLASSLITIVIMDRKFESKVKNEGFLSVEHCDKKIADEMKALRYLVGKECTDIKETKVPTE